MLEVFTIGGGEYLVNTFNAVAAWSGGGGYAAMLRVVFVMGLTYSLLVVAFTLNVRAWLNWFLQATAIYLCLMVPTVSIKVTDRLNPSLAPATVAHVPLGLGLLASFTSQIGDYLTRTAETVFVMPSELGYSTNGMIYGARLFDATRNFSINDAEFAANLQEHNKNCVFYDVMLGRKSLTDLGQAADLWAAIGPGSPARSQRWVTRDRAGVVTDAIVSCDQAYQLLSAQWEGLMDRSATLWGKQIYPRLGDAAAAAKLKHDVPAIAGAFTGAATDYTSVMRQNTAINAFLQARDAMSGSNGAASIDTFAQTRADIQARNTYNSIAQQAMSWVPILNIVLTVVFFAMFPVIFPLFLMPQSGVAALKGYAMGFFYLAAWGPLYVILHMICMSRATAATTAMADGGVTLGSFDRVGAVNAETATIAGFMLMSVPFLAAGLARGAMSIAGQSMSMLSPAQNAAEAAALEQTTGNYSFANESWSNQTSNMRQSSQWLSAASYMTGATSFGVRQENGATVSGFGNGQEVFDTSGAISRLAFTPTMTSNTVAEWRQLASQAHRQAQVYENAASEILTATHTDRVGVSATTERSSGSEASAGSQSSTGIERFDRTSRSSSDGTEQRTSTSAGVRTSDSYDRSASRTEQITGNASAGIGGSAAGRGGGAGRGAGIFPSVGGSASRTGTQSDQLQQGVSRSRTTEDQNSSTGSLRDEHSNGRSATEGDGTYERAGSFSRTSTSSSTSHGTEDALSRAASYSITARRLEEFSQALSRDASYAESHAMALSENMSQDLAQWYRAEQLSNPGLDAPELFATVLTDQQREVRQLMVQRWAAEKQDHLRQEVTQSLAQPDLVTVSRPGIRSTADVEDNYNPPSRVTPSIVPGQTRASQARDVIDAGRGVLDDRHDAAAAGRSLAADAASELDGQVQRDLDRGFFALPRPGR